MFSQIVNKLLDANLTAQTNSSKRYRQLCTGCFIQWSFVKRSVNKLLIVLYKAVLMQNIYGHIFAAYWENSSTSPFINSVAENKYVRGLNLTGMTLLRKKM